MAQSLKQLLRRFQSIRFAEIPIEVRQKIHGICANYVGGTWAAVGSDDVVIQQIRGGTSNMIFLCSLPTANGFTNGNGVYDDSKTPKELLLRIYFNPNTENNVLEESLVFTLLSERKLGPKLYGAFTDGRLEEYIHARALRPSEIRSPVLSAKIARVLAQVHTLAMPIDKRPVYLRDSMKRWMSELRAMYKAKETGPVVITESPILEKALNVDELEAEVDLVIRCIERSQSPVVFCHNDFQPGNILVKGLDAKHENVEFRVIDYEYSCYNYRAFDIANHFCEWTFDYESSHEHPYFLCNPEFLPTEQQQALFASNYLQGLISSKSDLHGSISLPHGQVQDLIREVKPFVPVSHFFWSLWALLLAETSPVQFGFAEYARCRLELYYRLRPDLLNLLTRPGPNSGPASENGKSEGSIY